MLFIFLICHFAVFVFSIPRDSTASVLAGVCVCVCAACFYCSENKTEALLYKP